jgi:F-type H+-transporting ATPase subunit gamma
MALRQAAGSLLQRLGAVSLESSVLVTSSAQASGLLGSGSANAVRHGSNQAVKQRIRAIKNIGKITKAMKMVAASKMRNAQQAVENSRGMVNPFVRLFGDYPAIDPPKSVTVAVTSDKGLCGGLNSNITKYTKALLQMYKGNAESGGDSIITIGDKGRAQMQRVAPDKIKISIADTYKDKVTFSQASLIAEEILRQQGDAVRVIFNKFYSAISFRPTLATVLNADALDRQLAGEQGSKLDVYELEVANERADVLQDLSEFQLAVTLYNAMLENNCSEHASRMSAMENSSKSAGEILGRLTLQYNRDRQAMITNELIEIISGAAALEESG